MKLEPCPFCGVVPTCKRYMDAPSYFYEVSCTDRACPAWSVEARGDTEEEAIEAWNQRESRK